MNQKYILSNQQNTSGSASRNVSSTQVPSTSLALLPEALSLHITDDHRLAAGGTYTPSAARVLPSPKRTELNENLDTIDADLESLKEMLASGQYSLDASTLLGLFSPEGPVPQTPEHLLGLALGDQHPLSGFSIGKEEENKRIQGKEVVQYVNPTEDMGNIFELDGPDTDLLQSACGDDMFPELNSALNTPVLPSFDNMVKLEAGMEEVD